MRCHRNIICDERMRQRKESGLYIANKIKAMADKETNPLLKKVLDNVADRGIARNTHECDYPNCDCLGDRTSSANNNDKLVAVAA